MRADVDALLRQLGSPGRYHIAIYIMLCCNYFPIVTNHLSMAIYGVKIPHHCKVGSDVPMTNAIPKTDENVFDSCLMYTNFSISNETVQCENGWQFESEPKEHTIAMQWNLVCDRSYLVNLATTIYFTGVMVGGLIFGCLSDMFGRKPFILLTLYAHIIVAVLMVYIDNYVAFVVCRFILGILMQGLQTGTFVLIMELFTPDYRTAVGTMFEIFWATGVMWLALVSYLVKDWRYIQLANTIPSILTIIYIWFIPESPRWLIAHKKYKSAEEFFHKAAKLNGIEIKVTSFESRRSVSSIKSIESQKSHKRYTPFDLFKYPQLRKRTMILFYIWFVIALGYYGLSLSIPSLGGNKYLNLFIGGAVEMPAYCSAVYILKRFGRKKPLCTYLTIAGVFCVAAGAIPRKQVNGFELKYLSITLAVLGRFGVAGCISGILLYTCELYPTVVRNISLGACASCMRIGGIVAPQVFLATGSALSTIPISIFGSLALVGSVLSLLLPETLNSKLLDTIDQAEGIEKRKPEEEHMKEIEDNNIEHETFI